MVLEELAPTAKTVEPLERTPDETLGELP